MLSDLLRQAHLILSADSEDSFVIHTGNNAVMLSAPHFVKQLRNGKHKHSEPQTGYLAAALCRACGCHAIIKTRCLGDDANFDEHSPYRDALAQYVSSRKIGLLLDLHQMAPHREQAVCIGTGHSNNIYSRNDILEYIRSAFEQQGIAPVTIDTPFAAGYPHTVSSHIARECSIPCFQIEINSRLLGGDCDENDYIAVAKALEKIINRWS